MGENREEVLKAVRHELAIAIESIDSKLGLLAEGMQGMREEINAKIDAVQADLKADIKLSWVGLKTFRDELKKDIAAVRAELKADIQDCRFSINRLESRFDQLDARMTRNERSTAALQQAIG